MYERLDETIRAEMQRTGLTGLAIALIRGRETVWSNGYGVSNAESDEPMTPETRCGIMSVTKPMIGAGILQLRDAGKFSLDDPVNRYLAPVSIKNEWEAESPVTIRQLLTHTSGLPVGIGQDPPGRHELAEYVDLAARTSARPGSDIVYANWGYAALGLLIERCSGQSVGDYLRDFIFKPLAMQDSTYGPPEALRAKGHFISRLDGSLHVQAEDEWPVIPTSPAGGVWSTALDLATFLAANLDPGSGILAPDTLREFHELNVRKGDTETGMGLGFRVTRANGHKLICHGGDGGGFTVFGGIHPEKDVGVALIINTGGMQTARSVIANTALALLAGHDESPNHPNNHIPVGLYRSTFWDTDVELLDDNGPLLKVIEGLGVAEEPVASTLRSADNGAFEAEGGMFHGFEVSLIAGSEPTFVGGVYPFTFVRVGDVPIPEPLDERLDLTGEWQGTVRTPVFPMGLTLSIESETTASGSTPLGPVETHDFRAADGRAQFDFNIDFPGAGDFHCFVRLEARGGKLTGRTYARSRFGEIAMPTELDRG